MSGLLYKASRLRRKLDGDPPHDWLKREPMIEVVTVCPRCNGDFFDYECRHGDNIEGGSTTNCRECSYGHHKLLVPLVDAIKGLR